MSDEQEKLQQLVPETKTVKIAGTKIDVPPLSNEQQLKATIEAEKRGQDNQDFFLKLIAMTLNENDGFEGVTKDDVRTSKGNILPLINAVQEANGLGDFLDEEEVEDLT